MGGYSPPPTPVPLDVVLDSGTLGTIQSPIVIATIENAPLVTTQISTIEAVATIENAPLITVQGAVSASIEYPPVISTIENAPLITVQGTVNIGTIENAPLITVQGAVSASVEYPVAVSTIENAPLITVQGALSASVEYPITIATIENAPLVSVQGAVSASVEYPVTVGTIENAPLLTVQGSVTASIEYSGQPSGNGAVLGTVVVVGTVATQLWTSTVLAQAFTILNLAQPPGPPPPPGAAVPTVYVGNSSFQWFELVPGAAVTLERVNPSAVYARAASGTGTVFVIYAGQ